MALSAPERDALRREIDHRRRVAAGLIPKPPGSALREAMDSVLAVLDGGEWASAAEIAPASGLTVRRVSAALRALNRSQQVETFRASAKRTLWRLRP